MPKAPAFCSAGGPDRPTKPMPGPSMSLPWTADSAALSNGKPTARDSWGVDDRRHRQHGVTRKLLCVRALDGKRDGADADHRSEAKDEGVQHDRPALARWLLTFPRLLRLADGHPAQALDRNRDDP